MMLNLSNDQTKIQRIPYIQQGYPETNTDSILYFPANVMVAIVTKATIKASGRPKNNPKNRCTARSPVSPEREAKQPAKSLSGTDRRKRSRHLNVCLVHSRIRASSAVSSTKTPKISGGSVPNVVQVKFVTVAQ